MDGPDRRVAANAPVLLGIGDGRSYLVRHAPGCSVKYWLEPVSGVRQSQFTTSLTNFNLARDGRQRQINKGVNVPTKSQRFSYVKYDEQSVLVQETFKTMFESIEEYANLNLKDGRAKSLLMTGLEEAYMWTGKAIRDEQIARLASQHEPARG